MQMTQAIFSNQCSYVILTNQQTSVVVKVCANQQHPRILGITEQKRYRLFTRPFFPRPNIKEKSGLATRDYHATAKYRMRWQLSMAGLVRDGR